MLRNERSPVPARAGPVLPFERRVQRKKKAAAGNSLGVRSLSQQILVLGLALYVGSGIRAQRAHAPA